MHILIAPDSYKGSLTARQVCDILAQALLTHPGSDGSHPAPVRRGRGIWHLLR